MPLTNDGFNRTLRRRSAPGREPDAATSQEPAPADDDAGHQSSDLTLAQLRDLAREAGVSPSGNKPLLVQRLTEAGVLR